MERIGGKEIFETLAELVLPQHTALLIHDMQNDFCAPSGKLFDKIGSAGVSIREAVRQSADILGAARRAGMMIAYSRASHFPGGADESPVYSHAAT